MLAWCSAQSYGVYIVHLPIVLAIQYLFDDVWMGAWGKFLFVGTAALIISFLLVACLRSVPIVSRVI